jgi:magnesium-transporting ATPase (P-type)
LVKLKFEKDRRRKKISKNLFGNSENSLTSEEIARKKREKRKMQNKNPKRISYFRMFRVFRGQ